MAERAEPRAFVLAGPWPWLGRLGGAAATLIAEFAGLALALWLARDAVGAGLRQGLARLGDRLAIRRTFFGQPGYHGAGDHPATGVHDLHLPWRGYGEVTLAANQVQMQFLEVTAYALDGFAISAETLIGQAVGARSLADTRAAGRICMQCGLGGAVGLAVIFTLSGPWLIDLMISSPEVRAAARDFGLNSDSARA